MNDHVKSFKYKLFLWEKELENENITCYLTCKAHQTTTHKIGTLVLYKKFNN